MKAQPYLNFDGNTEEVFDFYKSVFGGEFLMKMKMSDGPGLDDLPEDEKNRIMHISLPIGDGIILMGSDIVPSMGHKLTVGNNVYVSLHPDSREDADRIFNGLSSGGDIEMPMADQFWGDYFGSFADKYGVRWMINYNAKSNE
ncbi:VOC family protein [Robertkochia solimangrovi]|uniref:VOC family protein n=1 Tax=Robertkochia solimangrovi TaxID=2213046 RepID=UPI00117D5B97|nr:VOC family protein [Robertkochia solimangrovi]TRZ41267.1 VOC family protein [Robertkochia solimangrovi]